LARAHETTAYEAALQLLEVFVRGGAAACRLAVPEEDQEDLKRQLARVRAELAEADFPNDANALPDAIEAAVKAAAVELPDPQRKAALAQLGFLKDTQLGFTRDAHGKGKVVREDLAAAYLGRRGRWLRTPSKGFSGLEPREWLLRSVAAKLANGPTPGDAIHDADQRSRHSVDSVTTHKNASVTRRSCRAESHSLADTFFSEPYVDNSPEFRSTLVSCGSLRLLGFAHNRMAVTYAQELASILERGGNLRVLALDPSHPVIFDANRRSYAPKEPDAVRHQHEAALATLTAIGMRASSPEFFEVRLMDCLPPYTVYLFDDENPRRAKVFVWLTPWRVPSNQRPGFVIPASSSPSWYGFFAEQVRLLWDAFAPNSD
jgi:hypothetical protein